MSRSLPVVVALSVIVMGLWHIYAAQHASFVSELFEVELGTVKSHVKYKQAELVDRVDRTQEVLRQALNLVSGLKHEARETDERILTKLENLQLENEKLRIRSRQIARHIVESTQWRALKDWSKFSVRGFMSEVISRNNERGPPELFEFPSGLSHGRHLCFMGNDTSNGTRNSYTFAWEEALPVGAVVLNGTTLVSETEYDHNNPWHSMYNLVQFVYWKLANRCEKADRLILFHQSELRRSMGKWITQIFNAAGLPTQPYEMPIGDKPICFQKAIVSRLGMGGVPTEIFRELYAQVRCQVRTLCNLPTTRSTTENGKRSINITLMVRSGARQWKDQTAWQRVIADQCTKVEGCRWTTMYVANMTFCEQIKSMMETDILVSVHGAQLTNMIFMSQGGRILEMFPKGWLELAGGGQYIYRQLALWNGLVHEGYWRDEDQPECPFKDDSAKCFTFYKDQDVGMNETHVSTWLGRVLEDFRSVKVGDGSASSGVDSRGDHIGCYCMPDGSQHQLI
ncbi:hypothetical protein KC19_8G141000 [Ceratodon purpureus]|uniref:Glycosyltransferase 61 catalytic domain-containing protein n=1 Tax=Ceratodon purpureus TaxID=3225 RepID=A0A8T0GYQ9_CERPU|nr:hypothetical protein KC19_8G141000 [Ceratodon purpureus]